jgi:hypothetical protein
VKTTAIEVLRLQDVERLLREQYEHALKLVDEQPLPDERKLVLRLELGRCYNDIRLRLHGVL